MRERPLERSETAAGAAAGAWAPLGGLGLFWLPFLGAVGLPPVAFFFGGGGGGGGSSFSPSSPSSSSFNHKLKEYNVRYMLLPMGKPDKKGGKLHGRPARLPALEKHNVESGSSDEEELLELMKGFAGK